MRYFLNKELFLSRFESINIIKQISVCLYCFEHQTSLFYWKLWYSRKNGELSKQQSLIYPTQTTRKQQHSKRWTTTKYRTTGTVPTYNSKTVERGNIKYPNIHIHDCSLSWLGTGTSIKHDRVKLYNPQSR